MKIYIDMDGVICNYKQFHGSMKKLVPALRFPQSGEAFWTNLKPIDGAIEAINKLRELHDVYILSGPSTRNPASYSGKRIWVEKYFDMDMAERLILCNYKGLLRGNLLIDDNLIGKGQEDFKGLQLHFGSKNYPDWYSVLTKIAELTTEEPTKCTYADHIAQKNCGQITCYLCHVNLNCVT